MNDVTLIFYALLGIASLAWALAITSRLASIRDEARKQTQLLEQIAYSSRPTSEKRDATTPARIPGINA